MSLASPIVLDLDGNGIHFLEPSKARFDFDGDGVADRSGWIDRKDAFLVFDRDGNGRVSNASELSFVSDKPGALSDLDGLRAFDTNRDGLFSALDDDFDTFLLWQDRNSDGIAGRGEMLTLEKAGVAAIDLDARPTEESWEWGASIVINEGAFIRSDGSRSAFADVALSYGGEVVGGPNPSPLLQTVHLELTLHFVGDQFRLQSHDFI